MSASNQTPKTTAERNAKAAAEAKAKSDAAAHKPDYDASTATDKDPTGKKLPRAILLHRPDEKPANGRLLQVSRVDPNVAALLEDDEGEEVRDVPGWNGNAPQPGFLVWTEVKGAEPLTNPAGKDPTV